MLAPLAALGWLTASAHCLLSFAQIDTALAQFAGTPCALEGNATACDAPAGLRRHRRPVRLPWPAVTKLLTTQPPYSPPTSYRCCRLRQRPLGTHRHATPLVAARTALLRNAVANITTLGPQAALTGPAARGDRTAIERQGAAVASGTPRRRCRLCRTQHPGAAPGIQENSS